MMLVESGGTVVAELELDAELDSELDTELDEDELGMLFRGGSDESPPPQPANDKIANSNGSVNGRY
jgi:hypothetical protein